MKITIITVCFNAAASLDKTIKSIMNQSYKNIEWVVVDGNSQDNTKEVIQKYYSRLIDNGINVNFKSEKDKGIYDAMNKGIDRATGEWCIFMNAGDTFYSQHALAELVIENINNFDIIYGDAIHVYKNKYKLYSAKCENELTFTGGMEFCHQSSLIRREILKKLHYNTNYSIAGDFDFFVRAFQYAVRFKHVKNIISKFQRDGISSMNGAKVNQENNEIKYRYNLITEYEYKKIKKKSEIYLKLRQVLPKWIIMKRHEIIMEKCTKEWKINT